MSEGFNVLWLQSGGCGGCSMSLLCAQGPDVLTTLDSANVRLLWHPSLSEASGGDAVGLFEQAIAGRLRVDALCVEGALLRGPNGSGRFHLLAGTGTPLLQWARRLAAVARYTVAVGTCAAYGGMTAGGSNPTDACGLQYDGHHRGGALGGDYRSAAGLPVINGEGSCTRGGYACINCTAPEFEEPGHPFQQTPSLAGIPIGLPADMPKAWFVALASPAKAATPQRLRDNAVADHIATPPKIRDANRR